MEPGVFFLAACVLAAPHMSKSSAEFYALVLIALWVVYGGLKW